MNIEKLYTENKQAFTKKLMPYVHNVDVAEDLVHDAFVKAIVCQEQYDPQKGEIKGWFIKILFSVLWNYKRQNKKVPMTIDINEVLDSEELSYAEDLDIIPYLKRRTNPHHRRVLIAKFILGYTDKESANICKTSEENVRKIVQRFRETVSCL